MTEPSLTVLALWAVVVGLDLASVLQSLVNRPLVAGAVAGAILGDPGAGLRVGAALELFALDVLPIGASRYPDYGAATVAAVLLAAHQPWVIALGPSVLLGLVLAHLGSWSVVVHRRVTAWALRRTAASLDRGEPGMAARVHLAGLIADLLRSGLLAMLGIGVALQIARVPRVDAATARALTIVAVAGGFVAAIGGAMRRAGTVRRIAWLAGGVALGVLGLALR
ncbi:MAG TPA: PTS sugar transporter subunit IIC [Gemmatimonadales bacterium]|nr:PTS sugar transporter subunit IIC [Gemmatimonadales bacterium]